jgi:stringent starvation protein B
MNPGFTCTRTEAKPYTLFAICEWFVDVNVVNRKPHGWVMVWAGISYG